MFTTTQQDSVPVLYQDRLVRITVDTIEFFHYSFPLLRSKVVPLSTIDNIEVREPTVLNGKWRIWGSGSLVIWFPLDASRPSRDKIFVATRNDHRMKIGFTVEDSAQVIRVLNGRGVRMVE